MNTKAQPSENYKTLVLTALVQADRHAQRWLSVNQVAGLMGVSSSEHLKNCLWALASEGFLMMRDRDGDDSVLEYAVRKEYRL